jgi:hypothetical protein
MPTTEITITVWICNLCGKSASLKSPSVQATQEFIDVLRWLQLDHTTVVCPRCRDLPEVVNAQLSRQKAAVL